MRRKLASIQIVSELKPIDGADRIVQAQIMGWTVVVRKSDFPKINEEQRCVFFEIDSILPDGPEWSEFMRPRKFRVKTVKFRGILSQGLALPISILPKTHRVEKVLRCPDCAAEVLTQWIEENPREYDVGTDVTKILDVKKYEFPEHNGGAKFGCSAGNFPYYVPKTDEIRIQSAPACLSELKGHPYYITLKCDGTSGTFVKFKGEFQACSRNWAKKEDDTNIYWEIVRKYDLMNKIPEGFAVQGEIIGPSIQGNRLALSEIDLRVFTVYDINAGRRLKYQDLFMFCENLKVPMVPVLEEGYAFNYSIEQLLEMARGKYEGTNNNREGLVVRPQENIYSHNLRGPLSFKCINNDYLLKEED